MKKGIQLALLFSVFFISCYNNEDDSNTKIKKVLADQVRAWNDGDLVLFMQGYWKNDSLLFITQRGVRKSWDSTLAAYQKNYSTPEKRGILGFSNLAIRKMDDLNLFHQVSGNWSIIQKKEGKDTTIGGSFSLIFKNFKGDHKIVIDHTW